MSSSLSAIPPSWIWAKIQDVGRVISGGTPSTKEPSYWGDDVVWFSPTDLTGYKSKYIARGAKSLSRKGLSNSSAQVIPSGTVMFSSRAPIGYVAITSVESSTNQGFKSISPYPNIFNEYLYYYLKASKQLAEERATGTTFKEISGSAFAQLPIAVPPANEQRRIVAKIEELFSELDKGVESLTTARQQLKTYRQSVLKAAFEGKLTGVDTRNWSLYTVGQISNDIRYGTAKKCVVDPTKTPVLRIPNIASGRLKLTDLKHTDFDTDEIKKLKLEAGDILIVRSNGSASLVGLSAIVTDSASGYAYAGYLIRIRINKKIVIPEFLNLYLHSPKVRADIERQARSSSGVHNVNSDELRAITLRVPPLALQNQIVDAVNEISSQIDFLEHSVELELTRADALRQSILKRAFSGQLVAQNPADEPASMLLARIRSEKEDQPAKKKPKEKRRAA